MPKRFDSEKTINRVSKRISTSNIQSSILQQFNTEIIIPSKLEPRKSKSRKKPVSVYVSNNPFRKELEESSNSLKENYTPPPSTKPLTEVGDYIIKRDIGQGTFGFVKLAEHKITKEQVAIKVIPKHTIKTNRAN